MASTSSLFPLSTFIPVPCTIRMVLSLGNPSAALETFVVFGSIPSGFPSGIFLITCTCFPYFSLYRLAMLSFTVITWLRVGNIHSSILSQIRFANGFSANSGTSVKYSWLSYTSSFPLTLLPRKAAKRVSKSLAWMLWYFLKRRNKNKRRLYSA